MRMAAVLMGLALVAASAAAAGATKTGEGFASELDEKRAPANSISYARIGDEAIYWIGLDGLDPGHSYAIRCQVEDSDGEVVHDESSEEPPPASRNSLFCAYMPEKAGTYRYSLSMDGQPLGEAEIRAERRILGLKPFVFVSIFAALLVVALLLRARSKRE